jgi:hypothetical protein
MESPIAPTVDDLKQAFRTPDPNRAEHHQAEAVVTGDEGITVLCSANTKGEEEHTWLIRLTDEGSVLWEQRYAPGLGAGRAIAALPDGGFAIAGDVRRSEMEYQASLTRVDASGSVIAEGSFGPRGATGFVAVDVLSDGSILAGGTARWKGWLVRVDGALRTTWELPLDDVDDVHGIASLAGGFAITASTETSTTALGLTSLAAFFGDQRVRWQKRLPTEGRGEPAALVTLPDGGLAIVGHCSVSERDAAQLWVVQVDTAGEVAWEHLLGPADEEHRGRAIALLADGGVALAGEALRNGQRNVRVVRLTVDGIVAWERTYGGEHKHNVARGLARADSDGLVLVGSTMARGSNKNNVWVLRLDGDGRLLWDRVFDSTT